MLKNKDEKNHPGCYKQQVQEGVIAWLYTSALGKRNLHFCDGSINIEKLLSR